MYLFITLSLNVCVNKNNMLTALNEKRLSLTGNIHILQPAM